MAISVSAAEVLPAWLEVGDGDLPPEAVQALYKTLAPGIGRACERARKRMGAGYVEYLRGLRDARDALAPDGKFKEWCAAYGLVYSTVKNQLSQADSKLADTDSVPGRLLDPAVKPARLVIGLVDDVERAAVVQHLRDVLDALGVKEDAYGKAVLYLFTYWFEHEHPTEAAAA
jgi:hypothetical protein